MKSRRAQSLAKWVVWSVVIVCVLAAAGFTALTLIRPVVTVTEAVAGPVVQAFYATGTVQPAHEFPIKSNHAGILTDVRVDKGDPVKKGQVLAVVSDPELLFKSRQSEAELKEKLALADDAKSPVLAEYDAKLKATNDILAIVKRDEKRLKDLLERNAASQTDVDRAMDRAQQVWSEAESIKAQRAARKVSLERDVDVAKAAVEITSWNLEQQQIKSPVDGVVLDRPQTLGTRVAINDHLMQVADVKPSNLVMRAAVDEEDVAGVKMGQTVRMTLYSFPGRAFEGRVERIYDKADAERRTFEIDVRWVKEEPRLAAGMTGELAFVLAAKDNAIVVPSQALQNGTVWTVRDGRLRKVDAEIGLKSVERVEIASGLELRQKVVISPVIGMSDGQSVRTASMDPIAAAGLNKPKEATGNFKGFN